MVMMSPMMPGAISIVMQGSYDDGLAHDWYRTNHHPLAHDWYRTNYHRFTNHWGATHYDGFIDLRRRCA